MWLSRCAAAVVISALLLGVPGRGQASSISVLHTFTGNPGDGAQPYAGLTPAVGLLWGTTQYGGASGRGTVFKINPSTGALTTVYSFPPFGGTGGGQPIGGLIYVGGNLYGTTAGGGTGGVGTIFEINPVTNVLTTIHNFNGTTDGATPVNTLIYQGGMLYGTTELGGGPPESSLAEGSLFQINPATGVLSTLQVFYDKRQDGVFPIGGIILEGGSIYGTTQTGGGESGNGQGTIFKYTISTKLLATMHVFQGTDGANPNSNLVYADGFLYGTTPPSASKKKGTIFKIGLKTNVLTTLYHEGGFGGLAYKEGFLYGAIENTLYEYNIESNVLTPLSTLTKLDGQSPFGIPDILGGYIFGTAEAGGAVGEGTIFRLKP